MPDLQSTITDKERLDYAWKHFALIADQRMKTFNFYVIVLAAAFTATVAVLKSGGMHRHTFCLVGSAHALIAAVFAMIDWRGCRLLRIASDALADIEGTKAFHGQPTLILEDRRRNKHRLWHLVSYRWAFLIVFVTHIGFGVLLAWKPWVFVGS